MVKPRIPAKPCLLAALVIGAVPQITTGQEVRLSTSYSWSDVLGVKAAYRSDALPVAFPSWTGSPRFYLEPSFNVWRAFSGDEDTVFGVAISPILQWPIGPAQDSLFVEAGIGGALVSSTEVGSRDLSTHFQFEDQIGLSWRYDKRNDAYLDLKLFHYSNAGIKEPNDGLTMITLGWSRSF
ncbi:Lipid A 3-O-deacylase (PagL) [Marinobacter daqiaonensis]|uniref:Lipid A 3-O-deacylase (PagL) n=1 Tax=Marinobacter daqiaonensis TaxID=650891 RepID=A0A1I6JB34_9GAMM|nr:acyloxyacyl hydrolase [Marinobacter daqiaonensis]SFR76138.1 Lipid A 3-O-deacylase (PagL) [Marinobacter daqiaonensis]